MNREFEYLPVHNKVVWPIILVVGGGDAAAADVRNNVMIGFGR